jgi:hypothetical protein
MTALAAAPPRPLRRAVGAVPADPAHYEAWHALASATQGLNPVELGVLAVPGGRGRR